jgi:catechol 2,3-dioxygenase-like lactoylglutathione lyase family enzyme
MLGLHHVVLYCADTERSRSWYQSLGFEYLRGYHGMHWFKLGSAEIMLHPDSVGGHGARIALYAAVADVDVLCAHALAIGLTPLDHQGDGSPLRTPVRRSWGHREFELVDPYGYTWAFTQVGAD